MGNSRLDRPWSWMVCALIAVGLALLATSAIAEEKEIPTGPSVITAQPSDGILPDNATEATAWVQYDDGTQEAWASDYTISGGVVGNKYSSTWGTFYCDQASAYMQLNGQAGFWLTAYTGLAGSTLQGVSDEFFTVVATPITTTTWFFLDGTTSPQGWFGNATYIFNNTAWIAAYMAGTSPAFLFDVGVDTSGTDHHGFALTNYNGTGYAEGSYNAMIRARFNGPNVPVELMGFEVE